MFKSNTPEAAVNQLNVDGGADRALVISLLGQIAVLLQVALKYLEVVVVADLSLNSVAFTLRQLSFVVSKL